MSEFLTYRIPGKVVQKKFGTFRLRPPKMEESGFVISDFHHKEVYFFEEHEDEKQRFHFKSNAPYVVSKKEYLIGAETLLNSFNLFGLSKAVYSRVKGIHFDESKTELLFQELIETYPNAFVYLASSRLFGTWIGATPEILLSMHQKQGYTMSLAGTKKKLQLAEEWSDKEIVEQNLVTEYIEKKLYLMDLEEIEAHGPFDVEAGPVKHLRTDFSFLSDSKKAFEIAKELHPTPAVAGVPTKEAIDLLQSLEHNPRQLYTGFLGEIGPDHSWLYVNLRCCQIQVGKAYLYVGGGYTSDSIPEDEWIETEEKSKTLSDVIKKLMD
ncbi:MAG: chorismate-binding protein [Bacteroidetes bacterium]|nr:chorismate-binding protein [Bacteroidota bacterium]